jgi:competence protein ComEA
MFRYFFQRFKSHFELDRRQAKIYFSLLWISLFVLCSPLFTYYAYPLLLPDDDFKLQIVAMEAEEGNQVVKSESAKEVTKRSNIADFSEEDWTAVGLPVYLAKRIMKFQQKGAVLRNCKDLAKVYGMTDELLEKVRPFVIEENTHAATIKKKDFTFKGKTNIKVALIDINTADSIALLELPGIGPAFAKRIIQYRKLLRGYVSKTQYKEVYGLSEFAIEMLNKQTTIKYDDYLNISQCDYKKLNEHLYLSSKDARFVLSELSKNRTLCWNDFKEGLSEKAATHIRELQLYFPCTELVK